MEPAGKELSRESVGVCVCVRACGGRQVGDVFWEYGVVVSPRRRIVR